MTPTPPLSTAVADLDLDKLEELARTATPGPWHWVNPETDRPRQPGEWRASLRTAKEFPTRSVGPLPKFILGADEISDENMDANADFIAFANPAAVLQLVAAARRAAPASDIAAAPEQPFAWMKLEEITGLLNAASKDSETRHYGRIYARQYDADMVPVIAAPVCATCGGSKVDPGGLPVCRSCGAAPGSATAGAAAEQLTPLDYRAQGREEALAIILAESAENPFSECIGWGKSGAPEDEGDSYWDEDKLRALLHIGDRKHDAFDRAEAAYWDALGHKDDAAREMLFVRQAPFYKPLHDFLSKHEAWDLMGDLKRAAEPAEVSPPDGAMPEKLDAETFNNLCRNYLGWRPAVAVKLFFNALQPYLTAAALFHELDKLPTYDPERDMPGMMELRNKFKDGDYYKVEDVRSLFAAQPAEGSAQVAMPRELAQRVYDRLCKAQIFPLASEMRKAMETTPEVAAPERSDTPAPVDGVRWDLFPGFLIDNHEGDTVSEEALQGWVADMLKHPDYLAACAGPDNCPKCGQGWDKHDFGVPEPDCPDVAASKALDAAPAGLDTCRWRQVDTDSGHWETACGKDWILIDGTPADNEMVHCHGCGKRIDGDKQGDQFAENAQAWGDKQGAQGEKA